VLTDFGLALDTAQGSLGEVFGTAHYTAPEQARRSNAAVPQSDLYSLGVILYEMLTGVVPFDDPSPTSVALQHITLPPPSPCQINPGLNPAIEPVLLKALAKDPALRYPSGAALMDALDTALQASPQSAGSLPRPQALRPGRSFAWLLWLGAAAILCTGIGLAAVLVVTRLGQDRDAIQPTLTPLPATAQVALSSAARLPTRTASASPPPADRTATSSPQVILPASSATVSATASATAVPVPVTPSPGAEIPAPSMTPQPSPTSLPQPPTPTLKYTDRRRFVMYYNETSFYLLQLSGVGDLIAGVNFERLDASGKPKDRFSGNRWAKYSPSSVLNACFRLEIYGVGNYLRPPACEGKYMASLNPEPDDPGLFWTPKEGSTEFQVLWQNEELVRCAIAAGTCEVYLP
jgi:serine/threonine protein kinase